MTRPHLGGLSELLGFVANHRLLLGVDRYPLEGHYHILLFVVKLALF
jgi:hypothetical protein